MSEFRVLKEISINPRLSVGLRQFPFLPVPSIYILRRAENSMTIGVDEIDAFIDALTQLAAMKTVHAAQTVLATPTMGEGLALANLERAITSENMG